MAAGRMAGMAVGDALCEPFGGGTFGFVVSDLMSDVFQARSSLLGGWGEWR
jgi:hypothetical protein